MTTYILDRQGTRKYEDSEKEETFRDIWTDIFRITDEDNVTFDAENERRINDYMTRNDQICLPYEYADLNRLEPDNYLTKPTTTTEIKTIIKNFKNRKAPGLSGIGKNTLINLPDCAIDRLTEIFNLAMSMGVFCNNAQKWTNNINT